MSNVAFLNFAKARVRKILYLETTLEWLETVHFPMGNLSTNGMSNMGGDFLTNNVVYLPVLKWKTGEKNAIENLSETRKRKINPIIEIVDYEEPSNFLSKLDSIISGNVYIDTIHYENYEADYAKELLEASREFETIIIPVLYFESFKKLSSMIEGESSN